MPTRTKIRAPKIFCAAFVSLSLLAFDAISARGQLAKVSQETSLKFVPEDVAYYASMLRNREQFDALAKSKAVEKLMRMPVVQMAVGLARFQWENPQEEGVIAFKQFVSEPENEELINSIVDGLSNEIFITGDDGFATLLELVNHLSSLQRLAQIEALTSGKQQQEVIVERLLNSVEESLGDVSVPSIVWGFKVSNEQRVRGQLERLENLLSATFEQQAPDLRTRLRRESVNGSEFLTFHFDGQLIPFDQIPLNDLGEQRDKVEEIIEQLKETTAVIGMGVFRGYFIVAIGEDFEFFNQFGKGKLLASREELKPLQKVANERLVSINYLSEDLMQRLGSSEGQIDSLVEIAEAAIPSAPIDNDLKEELTEDVHKLAEKIKEFVPENGSVFGYSFLTSNGYEGFSYNRGDTARVDGSQPLSILNHLGGSPLMFFAGRGQSDPADYETFVEFAKRAFYYVEKGVLPNLDGDDKSKFELFRNALLPSVKRLDTITRDFFIPGFEDSQAAFVIDADSTSKQWHQAMPPSENPLPMLEFAIVAGVSDDSLVKMAFQGYFETIQEVLDRLHAIDANEFPEIMLPGPKSRDFGNGTVYYYSLPEVAGLDQQISPAAGLGKKIAVASPFPKFAKRILDGAAPQNFGAPLANADANLAAATYVNIEGFFEAIVPWVEYGFTIAEQQQGNQPNGGNPMMLGIKSQISTAFSVLKCLGSASSSTRIDDEVAIMHFEWRIHDVD